MNKRRLQLSGGSGGVSWIVIAGITRETAVNVGVCVNLALLLPLKGTY